MSPSESPESVAAARRAQAWSDYWAGGALHSCAGSYAGNYGGAIAAFWREIFADLPADATVTTPAVARGSLFIRNGDEAVQNWQLER